MAKWGLSVREAAQRIGRSTLTVRRWFDAEQAQALREGRPPASGKVLEAPGGRTGGRERRFNPAWVELKRAEVAAMDAEAAAPPPATPSL